MANNTPEVPTYQNNWGEMVESRPFYKGVEIAKANKSSVRPKAGARPLFHYVNKAGATGDWYDVKDVFTISKEDKDLVRELEKQRTDLFKSYRAGAITRDQFNARDDEIVTTINKLAH